MCPKELKEISVLEAWNDGRNRKIRPEMDFWTASKKAERWLEGGAPEGYCRGQACVFRGSLWQQGREGDELERMSPDSQRLSEQARGAGLNRGGGSKSRKV